MDQKIASQTIGAYCPSKFGLGPTSRRSGMTIRFINTTTRLPVDRKIEEIFLETICPLYKDATDSAQQRQAYVDIFFANVEDFDLERSRAEQDSEFSDAETNAVLPGTSMDLLGVYCSLHPEFHRPIIKICPEKVMEACVSFKNKPGTTLSLARLYPALLIAVVIHELAHWIMDSSGKVDPGTKSWGRLATRLDEEPQYNFRNRCDQSFREDRHVKWRKLRRFIEESLANAFVLRQRVQDDELDFLKAFMATEPPGYRQGALWSGNMQALLKTANTWAALKRDGDHPRWSFLFDEGYSPLEDLVAKLKSGKSVSSVDFVLEFHQYLASRADIWQRKFEENRSSVWHERLNGSHVVLDTLANLGEPSDRLKFWTQWATNGSHHAIDKLHSFRADTLKLQGNFQEALNHQRERLKDLPNLKLPAYWHDKQQREINDSITELEALINP